MGLGATISAGNVPGEGISNVSQIEVFECIGQPTLFSIIFSNDISDNDFPLLSDPKLDPGAILSVLVPVGNNMECLVKGPVFSQQIQLLHGGEGSTLEVRGADSGITMDREFISKSWANVTDGETVTTILANYGLVPDVMTTSTRHNENKHTLIQRSSDLHFIKKMGNRNGGLFWITCNPLGIETGHLQRPDLSSQPKGDLIINREDKNLDYLEIFWDVEQPSSVVGTQLDLTNKNTIEGAVNQTPQTILGSKSLKQITGDTRSVHLAAPADDAGNMQARSEGLLIESDWFVQAKCQTSMHQAGKIFRAHTVVNVLGAGSRHSGKYFVKSVRHLIDTTSHIMEIELIRNGWNS